LFCRPVTGLTGFGAVPPAGGLLDAKFSTPLRIGMKASGGRMAPSICPLALKR